jgi:NDP-4-keto-2,6-dideoxyhexose 3-C-methyltransferase
MSTIEFCRICKSNKLVDILDLGHQGLASRFPSANEEDPQKVPLVLVKCDNPECSLVQLKHTVTNTELYEHAYGYRSGINATMTNHIQDLVKNIESRVKLEEGDVVVDIGSNDATLLKSYSAQGIRKFGVDPTGTQFIEYYTKDIKLIPTYFTKDVAEELPEAKVVTSISMFYDLPDPVQFMRDIKSVLHPKGVWVQEQSYMPEMLNTNSFDTVCHEHLEYYGLKQIVLMAKMAGLSIFDVEFNPCNGGSFRVFLCHAGAYAGNAEKIIDILTHEKFMNLDSVEPYKEFEDRCKNIRKELLEFLKTAGTVYLYGASTKGNTLLQYCGIDHNFVVAAAERNPRKYGCRTPITNIPIISESDMRRNNPDVLLVLPWHFKKEFIEREQEFLKNGGTIVFPLPSLEIVKYS